MKHPAPTTLLRRLSHFAVCATALMVQRVGAQTFRFDGAFQAPPGTLTFDYARATPALDQTGVILPPDEPRFTRRPHLLCGAPVVRSEVPPSSALGGAIMAAAAGVGPDGSTPLLLAYAADPCRLILRRAGPDGVWVDVTQKDTSYPSGPNNLLRGEFADRNAEGIRYTPTTAFSICHGLVMAVCQVNVVSAGTWVRTRTAVCYWDMASPQSGWRVVDPGPSANTQLGLNRGSSFQMQGYTVLNDGPVLRAWFPFSDYVLNNQPTVPGQPNASSDTGVFYLINATRPIVGQPWEVGALAPAYAPAPRVLTPATLTMGQHAHPPYLERFGVGGLRMVCPLGDSWPRNRVAVAYRNDEAYDQGPWAVYENMHGSAGTEFDLSVGLGNQFVGSAPVGTPDLPLGHVVGSDETAVPLALCAPTTNPGDKLNFTRVYGQPTCSYNHAYAPARVYGWNTFHVSSASPESGGPFVAQMLPGNQAGWLFDTTVPRILFSHDGLTWGQAWAPQDVQPWPPRIAGGRVFLGSADRAHAYGVRSIPIPATFGGRPLVVGDGGMNLLRGGDANFLVPQSVDAGNRVMLIPRGQLARRGIVPPPAAGAVFECTMGATLPVGSGRRVGTWQLTAPAAMVPRYPTATASAKVRAWIYPLPWNGVAQPFASSFQGFFSLGRFDASSPANPLGGAREEFIVGAFQTVGDADGGWLPLTLDTDSSRWTNEPGFPPTVPSSKPFSLGLRIRSDANTPVNQCAFLIAFESVQQGAESSYGVNPAGVGAFDQDHASVSGFSCGAEWTIRLAGEVPDDAWDQTLESSQIAMLLSLCTLHEDDANHVQLIADPSARAIRIVQTSAGHKSEYVLRPRGDLYGRERFCFLRGSPILLSVSQQGQKLSVCVSVGGSTVAVTELPNLGLRPRQIMFSDSNGLHPASMNWFGGRVDASQGMSSPAAASSLADLQFLAGN